MILQAKNEITPEAEAEILAAAVKAARGVRDPEDMRKAAETLDRLREENRQQFGVQNIVVPILREIREYPPKQ